jgi:hypothetical protein
MRVKYVAGDGTEFEDSTRCLAYERMIEASKNKAFHQTVENLFTGCTSWSSCFDDDGEWIFRQGDSRAMAKFKTNLVCALPALNEQLKAALNSI